MTSTATTSNPSPHQNEPLQTVLLFGIPTIMIYVSFWFLRPLLETIGLTPYEAVVVTITVPLTLLLVGSLAGFALEKQVQQDLVLRERFRFPPFSSKYLFRGIAIFLVGTFLYGLLYVINWVILDELGIGTPDNATPIFANSENSFDTSALEGFVGKPLQGNYTIFILYLIMLFFNIIGEEFWWRGYILPKQERYYGSTTWIVHGLFWNMFHLFKWWDMIPLLGVTLLIPYAAQRYQENWTPLIAHLLMNGMYAVILFSAVFL